MPHGRQTRSTGRPSGRLSVGGWRRSWPLYDDKDVAEQIVRASDLDWTIVRPGLLTNAPATGRYQVLVDPHSWRAGTISRADVADFLAKQATDKSLFGKTPELIA